MTEYLQEEEKVSIKDILSKVQKLEGYIKKAERRIASHEKQLARLRSELKSEIRSLKEKVLA
jgi:predicted  nucleic acid-binding Zn-ribbon protein